MIPPKQLRQYIFKNKGYLTTQRVAGILSVIQESCKKIKNLTDIAPEHIEWGEAYPLPQIPLGDSIVLSGIIGVHGGQLPLRFIKTAKLDFFKRVVGEIAPYGNTYFTIKLKPSRIALTDLKWKLTFAGKKAYLGFGYLTSLAEVGAVANAHAARQMIEAAKLPLNLETKDEKAPGGTLSNKTFLLSHTEKGGEILWQDQQLDIPPSTVQGTLPGLGLKQIVASFLKLLDHPEFEAGDGEWSIALPFRSPKPEDQLKMHKTISTLGFPGKTAKGTYLLCLKDYKNFADMGRMADLKGETASQMLIEFEFDGGKKCRLAALCVNEGNYKLFFSFDGISDSVPLSALIKLKLTDHHANGGYRA